MDAGSEQQRRRRFNRIVVALGIALLAGGFFLAGGWPVFLQQFRGHPFSSSERPAPSPTPPTLSGPLPVGEPAIVYWRNALVPELVAASWSGQLYSVPLDPNTIATRQSPDGTRVITKYGIYNLSTGDEIGRPISSDVPPMWADDSNHLCLVSPTFVDSPAWAISIAQVQGPARELARVGVFRAGFGVRVLACSVRSNRVVAEQLGVGRNAEEVWVLNATTGAVEFDRTYPAASNSVVTGTLVIASSDGRYLAETDAASGQTSIRLVDNGAIVNQLPGLQVAAFSTDDSWVLVMPREPGLPVDYTVTENPSVLSLSTGQSVWQAPPRGAFTGSVIAQPRGGSLAIVITMCTDPEPGCQHKLWLIGPDGKGRELDHDVQALF